MKWIAAAQSEGKALRAGTNQSGDAAFHRNVHLVMRMEDEGASSSAVLLIRGPSFGENGTILSGVMEAGSLTGGYAEQARESKSLVLN